MNKLTLQSLSLKQQVEVLQVENSKISSLLQQTKINTDNLIKTHIEQRGELQYKIDELK